MNQEAVMQEFRLRTAAWYGDKQFRLSLPTAWNVRVLWPDTPPPLSLDDIARVLDQPGAGVSWQDHCRGKSSAVIIVDDLNRPTPVSTVLPLLLKQLTRNGIPNNKVTILVATGSHGTLRDSCYYKKIGQEAASSCKVVVHDCFTNNQKIGITSFGTPVYIDKAIIKSDLVLGIGGIYPNNTAGFGGGSKIALGAFGLRTLYKLHFKHKMVGWGASDINKPFRDDLDEIAEMIGMRVTISMIIDADRDILQIYCGRQKDYFADAIKYYRRIFETEPPQNANIIISNTYPNDASITFAAAKGFAPLQGCRPDASRIAIAACSEGLGRHNIFPFADLPRFFKIRHLYRRLSSMGAREMMLTVRGVIKNKILSRIKKPGSRSHRRDEVTALNSIWLYCTGTADHQLPDRLPGLRIVTEWTKIIDAVKKEQAHCASVDVLIYPCAFLQIIGRKREEDFD